MCSSSFAEEFGQKWAPFFCLYNVYFHFLCCLAENVSSDHWEPISHKLIFWWHDREVSIMWSRRVFSRAIFAIELSTGCYPPFEQLGPGFGPLISAQLEVRSKTTFCLQVLPVIRPNGRRVQTKPKEINPTFTSRWVTFSQTLVTALESSRGTPLGLRHRRIPPTKSSQVGNGSPLVHRHEILMLFWNESHVQATAFSWLCPVLFFTSQSTFIVSLTQCILQTFQSKAVYSADRPFS